MRTITHALSEESIFVAALEQGTPQERLAYIDSACAGDVELRSRVLELLTSHEESQGPFDIPPPGLETSSVSPEIPTVGDQIGFYTLLEQVGEGGFGIVYLADQQTPVRRQVALKVIKPGMETKQVLARFRTELQALSLMDHPNIARALDAGATDSGRPYFVMELVRGVPITDYCDQHSLPVRERLELFGSVCHAVQHAHQKGIIHRDIKPSNVLITMQDGQPAPKVIDFGVARAINQQLAQETVFTRNADMIGTPLYMSPEQAEMTGLDVDTRSDIYSLGVLLYELLTGSTPFDKDRLNHAGYDEVRRIIREEEPPRPSTRLSSLGKNGSLHRSGSGLPAGPARLALIAGQRHSESRKLSQLMRRELDWIVMKCLEKDRNRRYETANGLFEDVRHYLNDEPVQACPPSASYRFRKFARRHKAALAAASAIGLAVLVAVAASVRSTLVIAREQQVTVHALEERTLAKEDLEKTLQRERRDSYFHRIALADRELAANNLGRALQLLEECPQDLREWEWHYLMRLCRVEPVILHDNAEVNSIAFSPDGEHLASASGDGAVKVWNMRAGRVIQTLENAHSGFVCSVAFHPDGQHVASVGADNQVKVWDLTTGLPVFAEPCDTVHVYGAAYAVSFSSDGQHVAAGHDGAAKVWEWRKHQIQHAFGGHDKRQICVAFSHDGRRLASGSWRGVVRLWDVKAAGTALCTFTESPAARHPVCALAFSTDDRRLATASYNRRVDVWDTTTAERVHSLPHSGLAMCVAFSPDGRRISSGGEDKIVHVWDATTGREVLSLRGHTSHCGSVAFSPDGRRLASASMDRTIRVWDATPLQGHEGQETLTFPKHGNEVWSLAISPDGRRIVSAGFSMPAQVWDLQTGYVSAEFGGHRDVVFCVIWAPDGQRIASAGADDGLFTVKVWDALSGQQVFALPAGPEYFAVAFSPDGRSLVTGRPNGSVQVWDARTGEEVGTLGAHERAIRGVVFSPDGRRLASASADGLVKLWDATRLDEPQEPLRTLSARVHGPCLNVAFTSDGRRLATGGEENTVKIWDVETGDELQTLRGHNGDIYTVAFSPDPGGRWVASAGEDSTVKVWDSRTGQTVHTFRGHTALVSSVAFTPDGRRLVSGSRDHTVKVWDVSHLDDH
ncbi:MAG: WD40 repeat domain-containing serine/threonine protein kinase [Planctomycetaceae bacterium]